MPGITRRNLINGSLAATGTSLLSPGLASQSAMAALTPDYYPPALTGLRGSHPGSNDHAHSRAWAQRADWGPSLEVDDVYDLVVVGAGLSGLSAAWFYQQQYGTDKKILILDNHDDFGGHAKRNEHTIDGKLLISYGGSQSIVEPRYTSDAVRKLFGQIGVDTTRFESAYDRSFYQRHGLCAATYFNKRAFAEDRVVLHPFCNYPNYIEGLPLGRLSQEEAVNQTPLSDTGKQQLLRVLQGGLHRLDVPEEELEEYIRNHSYFDYLKTTLGVDDPDILRMARNSGLDWAGAGTDMLSIAAARSCGALGFAPKAVYDEDNPYIYHFPDGNAGVARALVKQLIPAIAEGNNAEELVRAQFDYSQLDKPAGAARIRLNSTVVNVHHQGIPESSEEVVVNYIQNNRAYRVRARSVVMACYNMMIPYIASDLPEEQADALRQQTKSPLQYSSVGLRNWRALKDSGIGLAMSPGNMHQAVFLDFPVSMGGYQYSASADDPCVLQMISCPYGETYGAPRREQYREARYRMLGLQFDDYEQEIREHLSGMLANQKFDFDRDVTSITVNRWAHGYTVPGSPESVARGRQPYGRISIANCDSGPESDAKMAIDMAWRAVNELS